MSWFNIFSLYFIYFVYINITIAHYSFSSIRFIENKSMGKFPYTSLADLKIISERNEQNFNKLSRTKRSKILDKINETRRKLRNKLAGVSNTPKKIIHIPALFVDPEKDGFQNIFYDEMITAAICLTSQPELNSHELVDEYEALICSKKGYGKLLPPAPTRKKRDEKEVGSDQWKMDKSKYDLLWKIEHEGSSTTPHPIEESDYDYDYEADVDPGVNRTGWETHDVVEDPAELNYMTWPKFLPDGVTDDDKLRAKFHTHEEANFSLEYVKGNLFMNEEVVEFDKKLFALNESTYLTNYYESIFKISPYMLKPLLTSFFDDREETLSKEFNPKEKLSLEKLRQLLILYILDIHHVNCFNRHIRFYGYIMKRPGSINGDEISNGARLARGIIMRALELLRHVPEYNSRKELFLRFLIGSLRDRASLSKSSRSLIGENDYTELYELASYLVNLLERGIHPDEVDQDLFVQETRFYSHHFMNTLTL